VGRIDDYHDIAAYKRKLFWQTPADNFQTNILRVGLLGFLDRMVYQMSLLSGDKLRLYSPGQVMKSLSLGRGMTSGLYKGNGVAMLQFAVTHALPATCAQKVDPRTNTVVVDWSRYVFCSFALNLFAAPLQMAKLALYNNQSMKSVLCRTNWTGSFLKSHLLYSAHNSAFVGILAYLFSQDWSPQSLLIAPASLAFYFSSVHRNIDFQQSSGLTTERFNNIIRSKLGRSMFSVILLANLFAGYRYFGMTSHGRIKEEYVHNHEAKGMLDDYYLRTRQFRDDVGYNKAK
jgi:hypothetical protein